MVPATIALVSALEVRFMEEAISTFKIIDHSVILAGLLSAWFHTFSYLWSQGRDARSSGYHILASELLSEAGRNIHKKARRLPFLLHFGTLVERMGLSTLCHMARWGKGKGM